MLKNAFQMRRVFYVHQNEQEILHTTQFKTLLLFNQSYYLTRLTVLKSHSRVKNNGQRNTLAEVRLLHWIRKNKKLFVFLHHCIICIMVNLMYFRYHPIYQNFKLIAVLFFSELGIISDQSLVKICTIMYLAMIKYINVMTQFADVSQK